MPESIRINIIFFCLLLTLVGSELTAEALSLRVVDAEGEKIASLEILEASGAKYVSLGEVSRLFGGTRKNEPLIGRITVTMMGKRAIFTLGQRRMKLDDAEYVLSAPVTSISNEAAVPVEFLTRVLPGIIGKRVTLDQKDWILRISREPFMRNSSEPAAGAFRVIIDPGHGGHDVGARSKDGSLESDLALMIAQRMKDMLAGQSGIDVHLTRNANNYITTEERAYFANKLRGHVCLSIHFNWSPSQLSRGFRIYINSFEGEKSEAKRFLPQSKRLAKEIANRLEGAGLTGKQEKEVPLAVTDNLSMPGVLVELLYLSNPEDLLILSSPGFIDSLSQLLCDSILALRSTLAGKS